MELVVCHTILSFFDRIPWSFNVSCSWSFLLLKTNGLFIFCFLVCLRSNFFCVLSCLKSSLSSLLTRVTRSSWNGLMQVGQFSICLASIIFVSNRLYFDRISTCDLVQSLYFVEVLKLIDCYFGIGVRLFLPLCMFFSYCVKFSLRLCQFSFPACFEVML